LENSAGLLWFLQKICSSEELLATQLGLSPLQFALGKTALYLLLIIPVLITWWGSWPRFRRNGFAYAVWLAGLWVLLAFTVIQVAKAISQPLVATPIPCPYDFIASGTLVALALYALYFYHLGRGNQGSFARFLFLIVFPIFGEVALSFREVEVGGVQLLIRLLKVVGPLVRV
jgi:hypothetical protein